MGLVEKVCEELGVEVGEKWKGNDEKFYSIEKDGSLTNYGYKRSERLPYHDYIERILRGELKPYWEFEKGDTYYMPNPTYNKNERRFEKLIYVDDFYDKWCLKNNLVFKTKEEAIKAANKMIEVLKEDK